MIKKVMALLLSSMLLLSCSIFTLVNAKTTDNKEQSYQENEDDALKLNEEILDCFKNTNRSNMRSSESDNYPNYYGGSYIDDNGNLNVMLTDEYVYDKDVDDLLSSVKTEKCEYSYATLSETVDIVTDAMENGDSIIRSRDAEQTYYEDITGSVLNDEENVVEVYINGLNAEKSQWFYENVCNSDCVVLKASTGSATEEVNNSGQGISTTNSQFSGAFRVKKTDDAGVHYGFITCAHGNSAGDTVYGDDGKKIGTVKLRKYGNAYDMAYVQMSAKNNFSNTITGSSYTLKSTNDDINSPVVGQYAYIFARYNKNKGGKITSTKVSFKYNGTTFSGMTGASYSSTSGDSGGLITTTPSSTNMTCKPLGVHKGTFEGYKVFTSAADVINYWHMNRY